MAEEVDGLARAQSRNISTQLAHTDSNHPSNPVCPTQKAKRKAAAYLWISTYAPDIFRFADAAVLSGHWMSAERTNMGGLSWVTASRLAWVGYSESVQADVS